MLVVACSQEKSKAKIITHHKSQVVNGLERGDLPYVLSGTPHKYSKLISRQKHLLLHAMLFDG